MSPAARAHPAGLADAGVLRCGQIGTQPPSPGRLAEEWGPGGPGQLCGARPDDHRQLPLVSWLPRDDPTGLDVLRRANRSSVVVNRQRSGRTCVFLASGAADFINGTTIEIDGGMLPGVLYEAGLKTITDLL